MREINVYFVLKFSVSETEKQNGLPWKTGFILTGAGDKWADKTHNY